VDVRDPYAVVDPYQSGTPWETPLGLIVPATSATVAPTLVGASVATTGIAGAGGPMAVVIVLSLLFAVRVIGRREAVV